jgi:aryl-alcohol dehydrogenase-like predicted oxidoreductase
LEERRLPQFALAWGLSNKAITSILCGSSSVEQFESNLKAVEMTISMEEIQACNEVWHPLRPPRIFYGR